jgi:hypothetical protein
VVRSYMLYDVTLHASWLNAVFFSNIDGSTTTMDDRWGSVAVEVWTAACARTPRARGKCGASVRACAHRARVALRAHTHIGPARL